MAITPVAQQTKPVRHLRSAESTSLFSGQVLSRPFFRPKLQMKPICACGGGCPSCQSKSAIQAKLSISEPGDIYEQEADRIADQVMQMPDPALARPSNDSTPNRGLSIQRKYAKCEGEEELQRKPQNTNAETLSSDLDSVAATLRQGGQPLDANTRSFFEPRFGVDFSHVRVHTGAQAESSARAVNALAFTVGRDVVFGEGQYATGTPTGQRLMAHELAHVVQQAGIDGIRVDQSSEIRNRSIRNGSLLQRVVGRLNCNPGAASAPADPNATLTTIDARAHDMAQQIGTDLAADAIAVRGGIPAAPSASLQSFIDHFGLPPAERTRFLNRLTGALRHSQDIALSEELRIVSRRFALVARILEDRIHYSCGAGRINLGGGCADDCSSNDFDAFACAGISGIGLCPSFWTAYADDDARAAIIAHEMLHMIFEEIGDETLRGAGRNFRVAGCYEFIVDDVFGTDSAAPCPAVP